MSETRKPLRDQMPHATQITDFLRRWLGREFVDKQIARAVQARRRYDEIKEAEGQERAEEWRRLNYAECTFFAREGGPGSVSIGLPMAASNAVTPNIDPRILRAARLGGPAAAKEMEAQIRRGLPRRGRVQTSALGDEGDDA